MKNTTTKERARELYLMFGEPRDSIPIKPAAGFKSVPLEPHSQPRRPTERECAAICVALHCQNLKADPGIEFRREFTDSDHRTVFTIENGCGKDILKSQLATLGRATHGSEMLILTSTGAQEIRRLISADALSRFRII